MSERDSLIRWLTTRLGTSRDEAEKIVDGTNESASSTGDGKSQKEKGNPLAKEPDKIRRIVLGSILATGVAAVGTQLPSLFNSTLGTVLGNRISEDPDVIEEYKRQRGAAGEDQSLPQHIIDHINLNRTSSEIFSALPPDATEDSKIVASTLLTLGQGRMMSPANYDSLTRIALYSKSLSSKLLVTDILVSELVRGGASGQADMLFHSTVLPEDVSGNADNMIIYINQAFSLAYTSVSPISAIAPGSWGFNRALAMAEVVDFTNYGLKISGPNVELTKAPIIDKRAWEWNVKGFYSLNWTLLYYAAHQHDDRLNDVAEVQMHLLRQYSERAEYQRSVWNMAFIIGMFYHRRFEASGSTIAYQARDDFFAVCLNRGIGFPTNFDRLSTNKLNANEPVPLSMALMLHTLSRYRDEAQSGGLAGLKYISQLSSAVRPIPLFRAIDQIRRKLGEPLHPYKATEVYFTDDDSLSIYLLPNSQIFAGVEEA